tara:strand:+ start:391 stop:708 length:318 start_codon:yes stop_codon:yes gene_type:complete
MKEKQNSFGFNVESRLYADDTPLFDGVHYDEGKDKERLTRQMEGVYDCISSGEWKTVAEISLSTGFQQPSISAQLRNLRKEKFGGLDVEGRYRAATRIFEYKLNR